MSLRRLGLLILLASGSLSPALADEPVLLKYKLAKGDRLLYRNAQEMKQAQTVMGMNVDNSTKQETIVSQVVDAIDEQGNATFKTKAERRTLNIKSAAGDYEFDSKSTERDNTSAVGGQVTPLLERLTGSEYEVKVSPRGDVVEVKGYAELIGDLAKDSPFSQFAGAAGDNTTARLSEQDAFVFLSDKPVKVGDTWERPIEMEIPKVGKIKGKTVYVYEADDKVGDRKTVRIGMTIEISMEMNLDAGGVKVTGTLSTTSSSGTAQFDPAAGRIVSIRREVSIAGQLSVEVGGMVLPVDTTQDQINTFTLLDKLPE